MSKRRQKKTEECASCGKKFSPQGLFDHSAATGHNNGEAHANYLNSLFGGAEARTTPDWSGACDNCGASPVVPFSGLCGPCTFGEADTIGGNW
jgi:hypothetical protein